MFAPSLLSYPNVEISRDRVLPIKGEVHTEIGQLVHPEQEVLSTTIKGNLTVVRLPERMGMSVDEIMPGIKVNKGDFIKKNDVLCFKKGLWGILEEKALAPCEGEIEFITKDSAHIGIRSAPKRIFIKAHIPGEITAIKNERMVTINSKAGLIQGVFGKGSEAIGKIHFFNIPNNELIGLEHLNKTEIDFSTTILAGGMGYTEEALQYIIENKTLGFITGSIKSVHVDKYFGGLSDKSTNNNLPVFLITEGFGELSISEKPNSILRNNNEKMASINGKTQVRAGAIRPELIFHEADSSFPLINEENNVLLKENSLVRIVRGEHFGKTGHISKIPEELTKLPSGVISRVVEVTMSDHHKELVSLANLESI